MLDVAVVNRLLTSLGAAQTEGADLTVVHASDLEKILRSFTGRQVAGFTRDTALSGLDENPAVEVVISRLPILDSDVPLYRF
jgi:hypothetical protein